jgi:hypothetical protein
MSQQLAVEGKKELEAKMAMVFGERMKGLSTELQEILLNDMVTALENRLIVLKRAEAKR